MAGLGRGLDALLSDSKARKKRDEYADVQINDVSPMPTTNREVSIKNTIIDLDINKLVPSIYQPRKNFDEDALNELALSIKEHGLLEPLLVKQIDSDKFEIICGERRYRAAKIAELETVPCLVRDVMANNAYAIALIENIQREDLNPLEQAQALEIMLKECNLTQEQLAKSLGKSRSSITNILRLNNLEDEVKQKVLSNEISLGHAKVLLSLEGDVQCKVANIVCSKQLSVRQTEEYIKKLTSENDSLDTKKFEKPELFNIWENTLKEKFLGANVKFVNSGNGKGKITFTFKNESQLYNIIKSLGLNSVENINSTPEPTVGDNMLSESKDTTDKAVEDSDSDIENMLKEL